MQWFSRLADRITLSMYGNTDIARDTAPPARRSFAGHGSADAEARVYTKMDESAKWNALVKSRTLGLKIGAVIESNQDANDLTSSYGSHPKTAETWVKRLNAMYFNTATKLLGGPMSGV